MPMKTSQKTGASGLLFASAGATIERAPVFIPGPTEPVDSGKWLRQVPGNGNGSAHKQEKPTPVNHSWVHFGYVLVDVLLICANGLLAFYLRFLTLPAQAGIWLAAPKLAAEFPTKQYAGFLLLQSILIGLFCQSQDLYRTLRGRSMRQESWAVIRAVSFATLVLTAFIFISNAKDISRAVLGASTALNLVTLVAWRAWKRRMVTRRVAHGNGARNTLIIGSGSVAQKLARYLEENKQLGYKVVGFLDGDHGDVPGLLGRIEDLPWVARAQFVDEVLVTIPSERDLVKRVAAEAHRQQLNVKVVPELYDGLGWNARVHHIGELPVMELNHHPIPAVGLFFKRLIDLILGSVLTILGAPLMLLTALAIKMDSPGPALYSAPRIGHKGRRFRCYKFRTMVADADARKEELRHLNERNGATFKIANDPRITRVGRFLRRFSIDEFPQLFNVLKGEMSLVGPRPHPQEDFDQYRLEDLRRLDVLPGITGLWQVSARQDASFETNMMLDLEYINSWNLLFDIKILLKTVPEVLSGSGH
jgi:exopolysaccharide biosynthesis polyprenyl glycosylphosphotransferase